MDLIHTSDPILVPIVVKLPQSDIQSSHDLIHGTMSSKSKTNPILRR